MHEIKIATRKLPLLCFSSQSPSVGGWQFSGNELYNSNLINLFMSLICEADPALSFDLCVFQSLVVYNFVENKMVSPAVKVPISAIETVKTGLIATASEDKYVKLWKWNN